MAFPYMMKSREELQAEHRRNQAQIMLTGVVRYAMYKLDDYAVHAKENYEGDDLIVTITVKLSERKPIQVVETSKASSNNSQFH
jgi:hypothetical protein